MNIVRFAHEYRSLCSCTSFALLMNEFYSFDHCSKIDGLPPYRSVNQSWATCSGSKALPRCARTVLFYFSPRSSASGWTRCKIKKHLFYRTSAFDQSAHDWIRTSTPNGTTPSRWHVYQFHHVGMCMNC
jgi:hypothetical protein